MFVCQTISTVDSLQGLEMTAGFKREAHFVLEEEREALKAHSMLVFLW